MSDTMPPAAFPGHEAGSWAPVNTRIVASWKAPSFAENLAVDAVGAVFVSLHSHNRIDRYDPATGKAVKFASLPAPATGLAFDREGVLWATGGTVGTAPGFIWRIAPDGAPLEWLQIPDAVFLNGCTPHVDGRTLLVCESAAGRVLAVDLQSPACTVWLEDDLLRSPDPQTPGANGIKLAGGNATISVTARNRLLRVALGTDGSVGEIGILATDLRADDFAFASSGALYVATHPAQSVLRLAPDGERTTIAGPDQGAIGCTACAFGRAAGDEAALYVTTTGGLWSLNESHVQDAKLLRLEVSEPGQPLLQ